MNSVGSWFSRVGNSIMTLYPASFPRPLLRSLLRYPRWKRSRPFFLTHSFFPRDLGQYWYRRKRIISQTYRKLVIYTSNFKMTHFSFFPVSFKILPSQYLTDKQLGLLVANNILEIFSYADNFMNCFQWDLFLWRDFYFKVRSSRVIYEDWSFDTLRVSLFQRVRSVQDLSWGP